MLLCSGAAVWLPRSAFLRLVRQQSVERVVLPLTVDLNITLGQALLAKTRFGQKIAGRVVRRQTGCFDAMQSQCLENERDERTNGVGHIALPGETLAHPIAEPAALRHAASDIGQRTPAEERIVDRPKDKECIS